MRKKKKTGKTKVDDKSRLTLMAVQEKLGLFANRGKKTSEQVHPYLTKKPLAMI